LGSVTGVGIAARIFANVWPDTETSLSARSRSGLDLHDRAPFDQILTVHTKDGGQHGASTARFGTGALRWSVPALVLIAVLLRVSQYLANRSLWFDEAALALNVLNRGFVSLTGELDFNQGAPIGFLFVEKLLTTLVGSSEYALRLFPLVCSLASIYLFVRLARKLLSDYALLIALFLFTTASGLIYYASEVKQYSSDVAATLFLTLVAAAVLEGRICCRLNVAAALSAMLVIAFSYAAAFVALAVVGVFSVCAVRDRRSGTWKRFLPVLITWGLGGVVVFAASFHQLRYLRSSLDFPAFSLASGSHALNQFATGIGESLGFSAAPGWGASLLLKIALVASLVGVVSLFRRRPEMCLILILPACFTYLAYLAKLYPLFPRTTLFVVPGEVIVLAEGIVAIARPLPRVAATCVGAALVAMLCVVPATSAAYHLLVPRHHEELRTVLGKVQKSARPGDTIYLEHDAQYAFLYYLQCDCLDLSTPGQRDVPLWHPSLARFEPGKSAPALISQPPSLFVGPSVLSGRKGYLNDLRRLHGLPRVWVVYTHVPNSSVRAFLNGPWLARLNRMGKRSIEFHSTQAKAFLYDFADNSPPTTGAGQP
jgi:hypothetical protein